MNLSLSFDHVGITLDAAHLEATIAWYRDNLDLKVIDQFGAVGSTFTFIGNGDITIELVSAGATTGPAPHDSLAASHDVERLHHLCLAVDDLDATLAELERRGVATFAGPMRVDPISRRIAFIRDNVGTIIELSQPAG